MLYKHLLLYIWASEGVCVSALLYGSITCVGFCGVYNDACACHVCVLASNLDLCRWCLPAFSFLFFLPLVWIPAGSHVQYCSKATLIPLPARPPTILPSNNMVKSNTWSVIIWNVFVKPHSYTAAVNVSASLHKIFHTWMIKLKNHIRYCIKILVCDLSVNFKPGAYKTFKQWKLNWTFSTVSVNYTFRCAVHQTLQYQ